MVRQKEHYCPTAFVGKNMFCLFWINVFLGWWKGLSHIKEIHMAVAPTEATFSFPSYQPCHADPKERWTWTNSSLASLHGHHSTSSGALSPGNMEKAASSLLAQPSSFPDHWHVWSCCLFLQENAFFFLQRSQPSHTIIHASIKSYYHIVIHKNMIQP